ncbi:MAG: hypothetical protein WKF87_03625 [Chryseolinea sp.]
MNLVKRISDRLSLVIFAICLATSLNAQQFRAGTAKRIITPTPLLPVSGGDAFLFGLTNDAFGYILTKVDFNSFKRYDYISRTSLGEMTGEIYIREVLQWLEEKSNPTVK